MATRKRRMRKSVKRRRKYGGSSLYKPAEGIVPNYKPVKIKKGDIILKVDIVNTVFDNLKTISGDVNLRNGILTAYATVLQRNPDYSDDNIIEYLINYLTPRIKKYDNIQSNKSGP